MENKSRNETLLTLLFSLISLIGIGLVGWKFLGCQEQPMESKVLFVFITFLIGAFIFRWIQRKSATDRLKNWTREAIEWSDTGVSAVVLAFLIMAFVIQAFKIPSGSMIPTLLIGDHLFVNKFIYGTQVPFTQKKLWNLKKVKRFDVIVFLCPPEALNEEDRKKGIKKDFIKRAIGFSGDTIEIKNKVLYINGEKVQDLHAHFLHPTFFPKPYLWQSQEDYQKGWERGDFAYLPPEAVRDNFGPIKVPENHIFVMGDNRDGSFDSRFWGPLHEKYLKGKAWAIYWPIKRVRALH